MNDFMSWSECEKSFVRKIQVDSSKIKSLHKASNSRELFLKSLTVTKDNVSFIVEGYYEVIKELLTALLLSKGLKSKNHQCLITYFYKNYPSYENLANFILGLNSVRNKLNYYGRLIEYSYYEDNFEKINKTIKTLKELLSDYS